MTGSWTFGDRKFADLDSMNVNGLEGAGYHRLIASVVITMHDRPPEEIVEVTNLSGDLKIWDERKGHKEVFLGRVLPWSDNLIVSSPFETSPSLMTFEMEMDAKRIQAIEKIRRGGDLTLSLNLFGVARCGKEPPQRVEAKIFRLIGQSQWVKALESMGYSRTLLLEIPLLDDEEKPGFAEAAGHLKTAQTHLLKGHFREAVGACRDVLECLAKALGDEKETDSVKFENLREMNKDERLRLVRRALKIVTHPARHADEVAAQIEWGPEDARAVIMMTAALLQMVVKT